MAPLCRRIAQTCTILKPHLTTPASTIPRAWSKPTTVAGISSRRSAGSTAAVSPKAHLQPSPRWLSDLLARIGKCITFGCSPAQVTDATFVLRALATEWRQLLAGSEGYLTGGRRGLENHKVVWGEMDSFAHVNNVVYTRYAESSRVNWVTHFATHVDPRHGKQWLELMQPKTVGLILKSLTTEFKFPMTYPDTISVYHKLRVSPESDPKATSLLLDGMVLSHSHRRIAARFYEDVSFYDYRIPSKTQMPDFVREVLIKVWEEQVAETTYARSRISELTAAVRKLEKATWDRADAVEDLGSATP